MILSDAKYPVIVGILMGVIGYNSQTASMPIVYEPDTAVTVDVSTLSETQLRARKGAEAYLRIMGYSRKNLIEAVSSEKGLGFSRIDAIAAVDSLSVDWNHQAERAAISYVEMMPFSCDGLIAQLSMDAGSGFTKHQAEYGARKTEACREIS